MFWKKYKRKNNADRNKLGKKRIQTLKASQMTVSNGSLHPILSVLAPLDMHDAQRQ